MQFFCSFRYSMSIFSGSIGLTASSVAQSALSSFLKDNRLYILRIGSQGEAVRPKWPSSAIFNELLRYYQQILFQTVSLILISSPQLNFFYLLTYQTHIVLGLNPLITTEKGQTCKNVYFLCVSLILKIVFLQIYRLRLFQQSRNQQYYFFRASIRFHKTVSFLGTGNRCELTKNANKLDLSPKFSLHN